MATGNIAVDTAETLARYEFLTVALASTTAADRIHQVVMDIMEQFEGYLPSEMSRFAGLARSL